MKLAISMAFIVIIATSILMVKMPPAFAHTEVKVGNMSIEGGWGTEPTLRGQLNTVVLSVTTISDGKPVVNAFSNAEVRIKKGGDSKILNVKPTEESGIYSADILPTQLGQYTIVVNGTIAGQKVNTPIEIEDALDTRGISFPESGGSDQGIPQGFIDQMRGVISDLTTQVEGAKASSEQAGVAVQNITKLVEDTNGLANRAYLVGIIGVGVGVAGVAVGAIALSRKS